MQSFLINQKNYLIVAFVVFGITTLLILLTPLRHVALIEPRIDDIKSAEFQELYAQNPDKYIFIDVRSPEEFNKIHAEGSVNVPLHLLYDERLNLPKTGKTIVLILYFHALMSIR